MPAARALHPLFAAELSGVDLRVPLTATARDAIVAAMDRYAVCVIHHETPPSNEAQIAFSALFGPLFQHRTLKITGDTSPRWPYSELNPVGNLGADGAIKPPTDRHLQFKKADLLWHTDVSFRENRGVYSFLSAHVLPPAGGDTEFADMRAAYDALGDERKRQIEDLVAEHSIWHSRAQIGFTDPTPEELASMPPARHRIVGIHPGSKRKTLYIASHASQVVGRPVDEGRALLRELIEHATQPQFVYRHRWTRGDLVIWDNRCTMHRATPFDDAVEPRDLRRTTTYETVPA